MVLTEAFTADAGPTHGATLRPATGCGARPGPRARSPRRGTASSAGSASPARSARCSADVRLLTLTGPGGIGKSRLAIEVATRSADVYADGAWYVDLAGLRDPALWRRRSRTPSGSARAPGALPVQSLKSYLTAMQALLLLDSFETVTDAAPLLVDLVSLRTVRVDPRHKPQRAPAARRAGISVAAAGGAGPRYRRPHEQRGTGAVPGAGAGREPHPRLTDGERGAAAEICRRLDGVPLSLELAAARTRLLPPSALLGKLENALDALGSGPVDLPERQRALRTTLDWDHALLSDCEQIVLRRLSVFPRHFTLEAAEHVVGDPGLDVFDALDGLVGKSLVRPFEAELPGEPRFVQLQTVREYAHERLDAAGESDSTHRRHAAHVLARVELADGSATERARGLAVGARTRARRHPGGAGLGGPGPRRRHAGTDGGGARHVLAVPLPLQRGPPLARPCARSHRPVSAARCVPSCSGPPATSPVPAATWRRPRRSTARRSRSGRSSARTPRSPSRCG